MELKEPKIPKTFEEKQNYKRLIVVLEGANLETIKVFILINNYFKNNFYYSMEKNFNY